MFCIFIFLSSALVDFIDTLNEGTEKITLHGQNMTRNFAGKGEIKLLSAMLGSVILARNRLAFYEPRVRCAEKPVPFEKSIEDLNELISSVTTQVQRLNLKEAFTMQLFMLWSPNLKKLNMKEA